MARFYRDDSCVIDCNDVSFVGFNHVIVGGVKIVLNEFAADKLKRQFAAHKEEVSRKIDFEKRKKEEKLNMVLKMVVKYISDIQQERLTEAEEFFSALSISGDGDIGKKIDGEI